MIHIVVGKENMVKCIQAVKAHLPLMLGEIKARIDQGKPMFSFESFDVDEQFVRKLIADLRSAGAALTFWKEGLRERFELQETEVYGAIAHGAEISEQVDRDMEREATRVVAVVSPVYLAQFQELVGDAVPKENVFALGWDGQLLRFLELARKVPDAVQFYLLDLDEEWDPAAESAAISEIERLMGMD